MTHSIYYSLSVRRSKDAISFSKSPVGRKPQPIGSYCWKVLIACWRLASFSWIRHVSLEKNTVKCVSDPRTHTGDLGFFKFQPTLKPKQFIWHMMKWHYQRHLLGTSQYRRYSMMVRKPIVDWRGVPWRTNPSRSLFPSKTFEVAIPLSSRLVKLWLFIYKYKIKVILINLTEAKILTETESAVFDSE